jgi:hypothetical protein
VRLWSVTGTRTTTEGLAAMTGAIRARCCYYEFDRWKFADALPLMLTQALPIGGVHTCSLERPMRLNARHVGRASLPATDQRSLRGGITPHCPTPTLVPDGRSTMMFLPANMTPQCVSWMRNTLVPPLDAQNTVSNIGVAHALADKRRLFSDT